MNYLTVEELSKSYGDKLLFNEVSFGISKGQKVALIASNGSGKTTLLNIMIGKDIADEGQVVWRKDIQIAYLEQNPVFDPQMSVYDVLFHSENKFIRTILSYRKATDVFAKNDSNVNRIAYEKAYAEMDAIGAWDYDNKVKEILSKLKIVDFHQKTEELSGGQQRKIALAAALIDEADFLILDEPTNHLDIEMIEWLENFLSKQKLSLLIVTHDRYFLDSICDEIIELDQQSIFHYRGNYAYYLEKKGENEARLMSETEKAKNLYRKELDWYRRMPKARATKAKYRMDAFHDIKEKAHVRTEEKMPDLDVKMERLGHKILEINNIHKNYGENKLIEDFSYIFKKGDRIGVVGPNGCGKSTLFKILTSVIKADQGSFVYGQTVKVGYYTQSNIEVEHDKRIIDMVKDVAELIPLNNGNVSASLFLQHFGFTPNHQYNYYSNLSGGERRRLNLLMSIMENPNFLIFDEPTNDLDIHTLNLLEEYLVRFQGCMLIASHDRYLLDKVCNHLFVFEGDGKIKDYYASYSEYREQKDAKRRKEIQQKKSEKEQTQEPKKIKRNKPTWKQEQEYKTLEKEIEQLEAERELFLNQLNSGNGSSSELMEWSAKLSEIMKTVDEKTDRWMELDDLF